jgi:hypothetical protein
MIKAIFVKILELIKSPRQAWEKIERENKSGWEVQTGFFYPLLAMAAVAVIVGYALNTQDFVFELMFKETIVLLTSRFAGFYLSVILLNEVIASRIFNMERDYSACVRLLAYSSCIMLCMDAIIALLPAFFILFVVNLYTAYLIWEGAGIIFKDLAENRKGLFTAICLILLYALPNLIDLFMHRMMK